MESAREVLDELRSPSQTLGQLECETFLQKLESLLDTSRPSGQKMIDELGWELPKVVVQYVGVSRACHEISSAIVQKLAAKYDPAREMFTALFEIIREVLPVQARFALLRVLISSDGHPSMISLLLTCVKDEVVKSWPANEATQNGDQLVSLSKSPFISRDVLDIIQSVLRAKDGDVAELPTNLDPVVSALNLYRFLLIKESIGKTNHTGVLAPDQLARGRTYWLLPLRDQVLRVQSAVQDSRSEAYDDIRVGLDLLLSVLFRCLDIVESF